MRFGGIPLLDLLKELPYGQARFVSFTARSDRDHSTSLPLQTVIASDPLIAFTAEGAPLQTQHGGPVRLVVPGRYFYKSLKWLERIELLNEDRLGFWEADAGYHNEADPWQEQRYMAPSLTKQQAKRLLDTGNFSGLDLRGLDATNRQLPELTAPAALLRAARFTNSSLTDANFRSANLSNAIFHDADLTRADFRDADCEGADFAGADLSGADLRGASLFGASFCAFADQDDQPIRAARFDRHTRFTPASLNALTDDQRRFVESNWDSA